MSYAPPAVITVSFVTAAPLCVLSNTAFTDITRSARTHAYTGTAGTRRMHAPFFSNFGSFENTYTASG